MVRGRKEQGVPRIRSNRRTSSRAGVSGQFPSIKMRKYLFYRGTMQCNCCYVFDFDSQVKVFTLNPFIIRAAGPDGTVYEHTPDFQVVYHSGEKLLVECFRDDQLEQPGTQQDLALAERWATEHDHLLMKVTQSELEEGSYLANLKLLWRYGQAKIPPTLVISCVTELARYPEGMPFWELCDYLAVACKGEMGRGLFPKTVPPCLYHLLFHHTLEVDLRQPLDEDSLIWLPEAVLAGAAAFLE